MPSNVLNDDGSERRFVEQINELSRASKLYGPASDCAASLAAIVAENEAECRRMDEELSEQGELEPTRLSPSS